MINKTTKEETRTRIAKFFYKLNESNYYKEYLLAGLWEGAGNIDVTQNKKLNFRST